MKAVIYARVSTQEQTEGKFSIETQIADCEKHCQRQDDTVTRSYVDIQSGCDAKKDRAQFEQMLKDAKLGLFDKIIVWRPDRLFRGLTPAAKLAKTLDETAIGIEGVLQSLDRRMIGLWAWVAEQEIESIKDRMRAGKRASAKEHGRWPGGYIRYGYEYNHKRHSPSYTGKLEINEPEAKVVLDMFQKIGDGWTIAKWRDWANERGIPTKHNSKGWTVQYVSKVLRDRAYIGKGQYGKSTIKGNRVVRADDPVPLSHPTIIPLDLFNKVQARLAENKRKNKGSAKQTYILQHLGRCGECGGRLCCRSNRGKERYIYCCQQKNYPHLASCFKPKHRNLNLIENYIWAEVEDVLTSYRNNTAGLLLDRFENGKKDREENIAKAKKEINRCELERQRLLTIIRKGYVTNAEADIQFRAVREDEDRWQEELANLEALDVNSNALWDSFWSQLQKLDEWFDWGFSLSVEQKKEILNLLLDSFVLYKDGRIELRFKLPIDEKQVASTITSLTQCVKIQIVLGV